MTFPETPNLASDFIESVVALRLETAVFDCDGTLWNGDAGRDFLYWEIERGVVSAEVAKRMLERYRLYESGEVDEETMCGEMVTMHSGLSDQELHAAGEEFFAGVVAAHMFPEMMELAARLAQTGCELWAVSSTNDWVVEAGAKRFGIARDHILAASVHIENGRATDRLVRVPTDELKVAAIREVIGEPVHGAFGNSVHDQAMLEIAAYPFCVNPNADLQEVAKAKQWPVFWPDGTKPKDR